MKRLDGLWSQVVAFDNLWLAWRRARRGKSRSAGAVAFELDLERNLLSLQRDLANGDYRPGDYRLFTKTLRMPRRLRRGGMSNLGSGFDARYPDRFLFLVF